VSRPAKIRLFYRALPVTWPAQARPALERRNPGMPPASVRNDVIWDDAYVEWQAAPGNYDLHIHGR
jgi:hypothetical protein